MQKSLQTDRVVLVPGPAQEVDTVRRMYHLFVEDGQSEQEIAQELNAEGRVTDLNRPWTRGTVHQVLTNEKYVGQQRLQPNLVQAEEETCPNPPDMWVRADGAFSAIVEPSLFRGRPRDSSQSGHVDSATTKCSLGSPALLEQRGWLSGLVIDERETCRLVRRYRSRFGSLLRAYQLIGYSPGRDYDYVEINRLLRAMHPQSSLDDASRESSARRNVCRSTRRTIS